METWEIIVIEIKTKRHQQTDFWEAWKAVHFKTKPKKTKIMEGTVAYCFLTPEDERGMFLPDEYLMPGENAEESVKRDFIKILLKLGIKAT